jgi:hypothetical protein
MFRSLKSIWAEDNCNSKAIGHAFPLYQQFCDLINGLMFDLKTLEHQNPSVTVSEFELISDSLYFLKLNIELFFLS